MSSETLEQKISQIRETIRNLTADLYALEYRLSKSIDEKKRLLRWESFLIFNRQLLKTNGIPISLAKYIETRADLKEVDLKIKITNEDIAYIEKNIASKNKNLENLIQEERDITYQITKNKVIKVNFLMRLVKNEK